MTREPPLTGSTPVLGDRELWARLDGADGAALTQLYRRHCDAVYNFAFRRTASWATAEDIVQATFTARRLRLLHGRIEADAGGAVSADHAAPTAARVDDERQMSEVRRALARLPAVQREAVELVVWSGCSVAEAATALGVSGGTVKSRLHRARRSLTDLISPDALKESLS